MPRPPTFLAIFALATWLSTASAQQKNEVAAEFSRKSSVTLATEDGQGALAALRKLAQELGGRVIGEIATNRPITLEIPNARYAELSKRLSSIGIVRREQLSQTSITPQIETALELARRAKAREDNLTRIQRTARNTQEALTLEQELERASQDREAAERRVRELRRGTDTTFVDITLELPAPENIQDPNLPFPWLNQLGLPFLVGSMEPERPFDLRAFVDTAFEFRGAYVPRARPLDGKKAYGAIALPFRVLGEAQPVGLFGGMDLTLGGGYGFLYEVAAWIGAGVPIGDGFAFAMDTGAGFDGMTGGVIPIGVTLPLEAYVSVEAIRGLGISAYYREAWVFASEERQEGARHSALGDEMTAGIRFTIGRMSEGYSRERYGVRFGFDYRELMDTEIYQLVLGFGFHHSDMSN